MTSPKGRRRRRGGMIRSILPDANRSRFDWREGVLPAAMIVVALAAFALVKFLQGVAS